MTLTPTLTLAPALTRMPRRAPLLTHAALCLILLPLGCPAAAPVLPASPPLLDEVVVTGERTGPGLWHVQHGNAQLWILGSMSPLPRGITWRAKQVEQVLDSANRVLVPKPVEIGIARILWLYVTEHSLLVVPGGKKLKDILPPDLHQRFAVQREKFVHDPDKWERYRPIIASAFLQREAFHSVNLSLRLDLGAAVRVLAKKHKVKVEEVAIAGVHDLIEALKTVTPATENKCVEASLVTIESGLPRLVDRAQAWASGNVERIENSPEPAEVSTCREALDAGGRAADLIAAANRTWRDALDQSLQSGGVTLAVVNMDMLLGPGGLLEQLRTGGYTVDAP